MVFSGAVKSSSTVFAAHPGQASAASTVRIVAIAGASGSGKTYLARHLAAALQAPVLSLDSYYLDLCHLPLEERAEWNFDHPDALDWTLLRAQLALLREGHPVDVPVYDFATHTRTAKTHRLAAPDFLVLEGIFALYDAPVRAMLNVGIFVEYGDAGCFDRRMARDVAERGRTPSCVLNQYLKTVRPMFLEFIEPTRALADVVVSGDCPPEESVRAAQALLSRAGD